LSASKYPRLQGQKLYETHTGRRGTGMQNHCGCWGVRRWVLKWVRFKLGIELQDKHRMPQASLPVHAMRILQLMSPLKKGTLERVRKFEDSKV
jgi:hypothetical protein